MAPTQVFRSETHKTKTLFDVYIKKGIEYIAGEKYY